MGKFSILIDLIFLEFHSESLQFIPQASHTRIGILYTKYEKSIDW